MHINTNRLAVLLTVVLLCLPARAFATFAVVAHTAAGLGANGGTTGSINTTGANLLILGAGFYGPAPTAISDSNGNTWTPLTTYGTSPGVHLWFSVPTTVGAGHTFTLTCVGCYTSVGVIALSGADATPYDSHENGNTAVAAMTIQPGTSGTPSIACAIIVTAVDVDGTTTATVDAPFGVSDQVTYSAGAYEGFAMAYEIQTSANARNPTWTVGGFDAAADIAVFKAAACGGGGGGGGTNTNLLFLGVGK